jgi:hypothetical protein
VAAGGAAVASAIGVAVAGPGIVGEMGCAGVELGDRMVAVSGGGLREAGGPGVAVGRGEVLGCPQWVCDKSRARQRQIVRNHCQMRWLDGAASSKGGIPIASPPVEGSVAATVGAAGWAWCCASLYAA